MVSFSCEGCGDVLTKKKLDPHRNQCYGASYTCLDCMVHFQGTEYRSHTSCISEAQKYQGALYRPDKEKKGKGNNNNNNNSKPPPKPYVEDVPDDNNTVAIVPTTLPAAPSPPPPTARFASQENVNVFDYMVGSETPNPSTMNLVKARAHSPVAENKSIRFYDDDQAKGMLVQYGSGPVPASTPVPKSSKRDSKHSKEDSKSKKEDSKKDKKRKRLHVDTSPPRDQEGDDDMADAPPAILHSGLTGGLNRLLARPDTFPPSPDYSGNDRIDSPGTPLKKTKHSSRSRDHSSRGLGLNNTIMGLIGAGKGEKKSRHESSHDKENERRAEVETEEERKARHRTSSRRSQKLLEFAAGSDKPIGQSQMVVFSEGGAALDAASKERAELFLGCVQKGPDSEKGYSVNKALKRYHRERGTTGAGSGAKLEEEKELWRSLRLRKNEAGEVVVFLAAAE